MLSIGGWSCWFAFQIMRGGGVGSRRKLAAEKFSSLAVTLNAA